MSAYQSSPSIHSATRRRFDVEMLKGAGIPWAFPARLEASAIVNLNPSN